MPVEEGYEQIVNTRGNANGKHMGKCSIPWVTKAVKLTN